MGCKSNGSIQRDLVITLRDAQTLTVDDLEVAQFIYLLINNQNLRKVIDTVTSRVVLILGRFKLERKLILDFIKSELRNQGFVPVLFDFEGPESLDLTETVSTLAHLSRFVIADLTDPSCIPHELMAIVPTVQIPLLTLIKRGEKPYAMFRDLPAKYFWVCPPREYNDLSDIRDVVLSEVLLEAESVRAQIYA